MLRIVPMDNFNAVNAPIGKTKWHLPLVDSELNLSGYTEYSMYNSTCINIYINNKLFLDLMQNTLIMLRKYIPY